MMERERKVLLRVGIFVALGLVLFAAFIFALGGERGLFSRYVRYNSSFETIDGLKPGSPVRLAGVEVGQVVRINFFPDPSEKRVQVHFDVLARYRDRIRADTTATVGSRGLLGDKVIDLSLGSETAPLIPPGGEIPSSTGADYTALIQKGAEIIDNTVAITEDLRDLVSSYNTPELRDGITGAFASARNILEAIEREGGALNALIYDKSTGQSTRQLLDGAAGAARRADAALGKVDALLADVRKGDGMVGALLYDPKGKELLENLNVALAELGTLAGGLNGEDGSAAVALNETLQDMRAIVGRINEGEGSLGALINDPTVYEDLKTLLGNVKRNRILRELVRYSISKQDEIEGYGKQE